MTPKPERPLMTRAQYEAVWRVLIVKGRQWLDEQQASQVEKRQSEGQGYDETDS